jgi:hypothetical protein
MPQTLPPEKMGTALASISAWRLDPEQSVVCPVCSAAGLAIIDQSSRPYAEWYALSCSQCGLDATVHIPLGPPM